MHVPEKPYEPGAPCPLDGVRVIDMSRLVWQHGQPAARRFWRRGDQDRGPEEGRPAARLANRWGQRPLEGLLAQQEERRIEPPSAARPRAIARPCRDRPCVDREFPPGDTRGDGSRPRHPAQAEPRSRHRQGVRLGAGRAVSRPPGFGTLVESMSGYAARTGFADREPALPPTALADMVAGLYGAMAVLVALREVEIKGGRGQVIDLPSRLSPPRRRSTA